MVAQGDAENIMEGKFTSKDKHSLFALKALIESKLSTIPDDDSEPTATNDNTETVRTKHEDEDIEMLL
jgi:hypothetical protein